MTNIRKQLVFYQQFIWPNPFTGGLKKTFKLIHTSMEILCLIKRLSSFLCREKFRSKGCYIASRIFNSAEQNETFWNCWEHGQPAKNRQLNHHHLIKVLARNRTEYILLFIVYLDQMHAQIFPNWEEEVTGGMFDEAKQRTQIKLFPLWPKKVHCLTHWGQSFYEALIAGSDREEHIALALEGTEMTYLYCA